VGGNIYWDQPAPRSRAGRTLAIAPVYHYSSMDGPRCQNPVSNAVPKKRSGNKYICGVTVRLLQSDWHAGSSPHQCQAFTSGEITMVAHAICHTIIQSAGDVIPSSLKHHKNNRTRTCLDVDVRSSYTPFPASAVIGSSCLAKLLALQIGAVKTLGQRPRPEH
jgi:hypothetical protein